MNAKDTSQQRLAGDVGEGHACRMGQNGAQARALNRQHPRPHVRLAAMQGDINLDKRDEIVSLRVYH